MGGLTFLLNSFEVLLGLWTELWDYRTTGPASVAALKNASFTVPGMPWLCSVPGVISLPALELDAVASPGASTSLPCPPLLLTELIFLASGDQHGVTHQVRCHRSSESCLFLLAGSHSEEEETCFSEETQV